MTVFPYVVPVGVLHVTEFIEVLLPTCDSRLVQIWIWTKDRETNDLQATDYV